MDTTAVRSYLLDLQQRIVTSMEQADGKPFVTDAWTARAPAAGWKATARRSWWKKAICSSAAAATSAT